MRWLLVVVLVVLVALAAAACGGDDEDEATTTSTTLPAEEAVSELFTEFFSPSLSDDERIALLEDPARMRSLYDKARADPATGPILDQLSVRVERVTVTSDTTAEVDYTLLVDGEPVTQGVLLGRAVVVEGEWRIANSTLCSLLGLADPSVNQDPACTVT